MLQALPCIVAAHALAPAPGSRVLDMCAAPGGKTTMLAQLMAGEGAVVALDRTPAKVAAVRSLAADMGLAGCIDARVADSTLLAPPPAPAQAADGGAAAAAAAASGSGSSSSGGGGAEGAAAGEEAEEAAAAAPWAPPAHLADLEPESFDYVLLDAPCSALGLRPRLLHAWTLKQLRATAALQRALLHAAVRMLKPGGALVYSTCTINPGENEANVRYALDRWRGALALEAAPLALGGPGIVGESDGWLSPEEAALVQRFDPGAGEDDPIGFFIARFVKTASTLP